MICFRYIPHKGGLLVTLYCVECAIHINKTWDQPVNLVYILGFKLNHRREISNY